MEELDSNSLKFNYFRSMFRETVEKKIDDRHGRLTRLIKYTFEEARELVKNFTHDRPDIGYANAMNLLEKQYGDPDRLLASYRREIKKMFKTVRRLFKLLIKCEIMSYCTSKNPLDSPDVICMTFKGSRSSARQLEQKCVEN